VKTTFRSFLWTCSALCLSALLCLAYAAKPQERVNSQIRVTVELVQLNVAVTDNRGEYVTGLQPGDFTVLEDGIPQKLATFAEGNEATRRLAEATSSGAGASSANAETEHAANPPNESGAHVSASELASMLTGANVFILFDTSNYMYRGFVFAQDAIADFVRSLDNASVIPPEDVAELAQSTGTAIYMISTTEAQLEPISTAVFERMTAATGGKAYFAKSWRDEKRAFASIRDDLAHLYSLSYYPQPNPNRGWRSITVNLNSDRLKKCHVRTRKGYRLQPSRVSKISATESDPQ